MRRVRRLDAIGLALAGVLASVAVVPAAAAGSAPAVATGTLAVRMLDDHGHPSSGILYIVRSDGSGTQVDKVSTFSGPVDVGSYGVMAFTMWGGIRCVALDPCDTTKVHKGEVIPDGSLVVTEDERTSVRVRATPPARVAGQPRVGSTLRLRWSRPMAALVGLLAPAAAAPQLHWLRDGHPLRGETGDRYVVRKADAGSRIAVRMTYSDTAAAAFEQTVGPFARSRTTVAVKVRG